MKKLYITLSILLSIFVFTTGCEKSFFEDMDTYSDSDEEVAEFLFTEKLNEGGSQNYGELVKIIEDKINNDAELKNIANELKAEGGKSIEAIYAENPEKVTEFIELKSVQAEAKLGQANVSSLDVISNLLAVESDSKKEAKITDIVPRNINNDPLDAALLTYDSILPLDDPDEILKRNLDSTEARNEIIKKFRDDYLAAGIGHAIRAARHLLFVFDLNEDWNINSLDKIYTNNEIFNGISEINKRWINGVEASESRKPKITRHLRRAKLYLEIAFKLDLENELGEEDDINSLMDVFDNIIKKLDEIDDITEAKFDTIVNEILTGNN